MVRNEPPSPALPLTLSIFQLALTPLGIHGPASRAGFSGFLRFLGALRMQQRRHFLQVFTCLKFCLDLGDVGQSLAGFQKRHFDVVEMLDLMFNQARNKASVVV